MGLNPTGDPGDQTDDQQPTGQPTSVDQIPVETLRSELTKTRREAANYRIKNRELSTRLAAIDPDGSGTLQLSKHQDEIRSLKVTNALLSASHRHGIADPDELEFHLTKAGRLRDLDVNDENFAADVDSAVVELLEVKPNLRGPGSSAAPTTGAHIRPSQPVEYLTRSALRGMSNDEISAAKEAGLLDRLLGRQ